MKLPDSGAIVKPPHADLVGTTRLSLLMRLRQRPGDAEAWSRFVMVYVTQMVRWCQRQGLQEADAIDVTQEALVRFWKSADKFEYDPKKRFRGYLRVLIHATWADWVEQRQGELTGTGNSGMQKILLSLPAREDLMAQLQTLFDQEVVEMAMRLVRKHIAAQTWQAFQLLAIEGLSGKQAAEQLGMKVGSVIAARCEVQQRIQKTIQRIERADAIREV